MSEKNTIEINATEIKKGFQKTVNFFKQKKVINLLIIILLITLLVGGVWIRLLNIPLLKDSTTGKEMPLALDPFYFLRVAQTMVSSEGLPEIDLMRYPSAKIGFSQEIMPNFIVFVYKICGFFKSDVSIEFIDILSPVILFALAFIVFFFLILTLTKSKSTALFSSAFLAFMPSYLYRTIAGFSDHEAIGMFSFFLTFLLYSLALQFLNKDERKKNSLNKTLLFSFVTAFLTAFTIASWRGIANFVFLIIPFSFFFFWILKTKHFEERPNLIRYILFYIPWFILSMIFPLFLGISQTFRSYALSTTGMISLFVFGFIIVDYIIITYFKGQLKKNFKKYRIILSAFLVFVFGSLLLTLLGFDVIGFISNLFERFLQPFGAQRTGLTVAENKQPFLNDWIGQMGKLFFWLFFAGLMVLGIEMVKGIKKIRSKILLMFLWALMVLGILFSRISPTSIFNGTNFISNVFYLGSLILFFFFFFWIYFNEEIKIDPGILLSFSWMIFTLISAKGAIRLFFVVTPFVCFMAGFLPIKIFEYLKKSKDDLLKMLLLIVFVIVIISLIISLNNFSKSIVIQAKNTGPSAHLQWQKAMSWVREDSLAGGIFVHWWDYGYWVQSLGERPSVTDGGHAIGYWDHLIGRYLLTTPYPETALSFMKSHNVSYLLIDPTEIGKYAAYSKIGSGPEGLDRYSSITTMVSDARQTQDTKNGTIKVYQGASQVDEDIIYNLNGKEIFLPSENAAIVGAILEIKQNTELISFNQPQGAFIYNQEQITIPLRYLYIEGELIDFKQGLEATLYVIPSISQSGEQGVQIDHLGAAIYLSPRNMQSLVAQLYILDDSFNKYPTLKVAHSEPDPNLAFLNAQGANIGELFYFSGFRGPIKIWEVNYPEETLEREEFLRTTGDYAEFDDLQFTQ